MSVRIRDIGIGLLFIAVLAALGYAAHWAWERYRHPVAKVDFDKYPIRGIDISVHNGEIDFAKVKADSISFVWIKASEGESLQDRNYDRNYRQATREGLITGAYHFFRFDCDGVAQAVNLCKALGDSKPQLGVAIDIEMEHNAESVPDDVVIERLSAMLDYLTLLGLKTTIYTNKEAYKRYIRADFSQYPLWICSFTDWEPLKDIEWDFWQYSHAGSVNGIKSEVDLDVYHGALQSLRSYQEQ